MSRGRFVRGDELVAVNQKYRDLHAHAAYLAETLAATLDTGSHMMWCNAWYEHEPCTYPACARVREAVATARELGFLPLTRDANSSGESGDMVELGQLNRASRVALATLPDSEHHTEVAGDAHD
jgi:hypothetical protein